MAAAGITTRHHRPSTKPTSSSVGITSPAYSEVTRRNVETMLAHAWPTEAGHARGTYIPGPRWRLTRDRAAVSRTRGQRPPEPTRPRWVSSPPAGSRSCSHPGCPRSRKSRASSQGRSRLRRRAERRQSPTCPSARPNSRPRNRARDAGHSTGTYMTLSCPGRTTGSRAFACC